ncbi:hypothetical protein SUDANB105_00744 [Streptomyces sp. enrichment culture]|uniref:hypothetical protein n=1 Tax=Streptomyces sp. enrichment culture TaxID=1795815 RepID=UPI003F56D1F6
MTDAQITLAYSRNVGIVAIATGEQYEVAQDALVEAGFQHDDAWVYHLPPGQADAARSTLAGLIQLAEAQGIVVTTSAWRFIGDAARDIAGLLPGQWSTQVEIYSHPVWQRDLVPWLWDAGELAHALLSERIPYAATLINAAAGTKLLLVERPGHQQGYLIGAFAPERFGEGHGDPHAPHSIDLPPLASHAARAIAERYLPAYDYAVHVRRTSTVADALAIIRDQYDDWTTRRVYGHDSATMPLALDPVGAATADFLDSAWREFLYVLDHAPAVLDRCRPAATPWPQDARALDDLTTALLDADSLRTSEVPLPRSGHHQRIWPAIETWLAHADVFLRQASAATPPARSALPMPAPPPVLPAPGPAAHR